VISPSTGDGTQQELRGNHLDHFQQLDLAA
jgi:hypothetical protein